MYISVAKDFSVTPGGRYVNQGKWSGEEFRREFVEPKLREVISEGGKLYISLDGTAGYATSFLEEAFGGIVRDLKKRISGYLEIQTDNPLRKREVELYIHEAEEKL